MAGTRKKKSDIGHEEIKMIKPKLTEEDLTDVSEDELYERAYYQDSIIIKVNPNDKLIDDIATCFHNLSLYSFSFSIPSVLEMNSNGASIKYSIVFSILKQVAISSINLSFGFTFIMMLS